MIRAPRVLAAVAALVAALAVPAEAAKPRVVPGRVQAVADEFSFVLSRQRVRWRPVVLELVNFGEEPHELHLQRRARGAPLLVIREVLPGGRRELRARLAAGRFRVWCSAGDHVHRGMVATLTVTKRS